MAEDKRRDPKGKKGKKKKESGISGFFIGVICSVVLVPVVGYVAYQLHLYLVILPGLVNTPTDLPKLTKDNAFSAENDPELYWGSYAANLYFGLKTRSPNSPRFGVAWFEQPRQNIYLPKIRHWSDQHDGLVYGWQKHDGRTFGIQTIDDGIARLNTTFVKRPGGEYGGDWTARVEVGPREGISEDHVLMSVVAYFAIPGFDKATFLQPVIKKDPLNPNGIQLKGLDGFTPELGKFAVKFRSEGGVVAKGFALARTPGEFTHVKDTLLNNTEVYRMESTSDIMSHYLCLSGGKPGTSPMANPNLLAVQITFAGSATLEVMFESQSGPERPEMSHQVFSDVLKARADDFDAKFEQTFELKSKSQYADVYVRMAKYALSNMVGSVSYFHGSNRVQSRYNRHPVDYGPHELYTAMPCRPFFPRGFLWDEGFHHLLLRWWDSHISSQSLATWLDLMNVEGWIPRENILGASAAMKVPAEFIVQQNEVANPPMFFFLLAKLARSPTLMKKNAEFLKAAYPRLKLWYSWLNSSQAGPQPGTYRWRGRNSTTTLELNPKTLASGLDDYPRASHPSTDEYHLDLYCWMAVATKFMADLSHHFDESVDKVGLGVSPKDPGVSPGRLPPGIASQHGRVPPGLVLLDGRGYQVHGRPVALF